MKVLSYSKDACTMFKIVSASIEVNKNGHSYLDAMLSPKKRTASNYRIKPHVLFHPERDGENFMVNMWEACEDDKSPMHKDGKAVCENIFGRNFLLEQCPTFRLKKRDMDGNETGEWGEWSTSITLFVLCDESTGEPIVGENLESKFKRLVKERGEFRNADDADGDEEIKEILEEEVDDWIPAQGDARKEYSPSRNITRPKK